MLALSKCIPLIRFHCSAMRNTRVTAECTEEPAHLCTIEMHSSHTVSLHCYAEHALHCRDCDPMISIIANYTLTLETFIFRVQSQVIVRMKVCKTNPSAPA